MNKFQILLSAAALAAGAMNLQAAYSGDVVSSEGAWCWFADPRAIHHETADKSINNSYIGYIDVHGNIKAAQYDFNKGTRNEVLVRSNFQPDDHNNPTFLVLPDERVLIIYSRHTDEPAFYYRVSKKPGDITDLGEEKCIKTANNTTYPSPFILSDDPEHFYLCWRGIGWHPTIAKFTLPDANDDVKAVYGPYQMVQSTGARPYAKYYSNGKDKLYFTYTTGHPDNEQPNWVYFNVVDIQATKDAQGKVTTNPILTDIKGNKLSTISAGKFNVNKTADYKSNYPYTIVDAPSNLRDWVWQITTDSEDRPVIAMVKITGGKDQHEYYYAKWTGNQWRLTDLADGGGRFHSSNTEYCYSGGEALDPQNPNIIYLSIPTQGANGKVYEIWKYTLDDNGVVTAKEQITKDSKKNNVRPYVLPDSEGSPLRLGWMNGDYYYWMVQKNYPAGYPTSIRCDYEYVPTMGNHTPIFQQVYNETLKSNESESIAAPAAGSPFTLCVSLSIAGDSYKGTLLSSKDLTYALNGSTIYPEATVKGTLNKSQNKLYTSDNWAYNSGGTSGDNWPTKLDNVSLTFAYNGKDLTIYRNGVIDQVIPAEGLSLENLKIGGFDGTLGAVSLYNTCLNQDEVNKLLQDMAFEVVQLPETAYTDIVLPAAVNGETLEWVSSHPDIIDANGTFRAPAESQVVTMTAKTSNAERGFSVVAMPRNIAKNLRAHYTFEAEDMSEENGHKLVADKSGRGYDLEVMGSAVVDGTLNLTGNTTTNFNANGYAVAPAELMKGLRSYTFIFDAEISASSKQPRFYDFGANSGNSVFCRVTKLTAGEKYNGGTTLMVDANTSLQMNRTYKVAVTFDARTHATTIYVDGKQVGNGTNVTYEPYMISELARAERNYIGRTQWWDANVANDNQDYIGTIDNFRLYDTALTPDEMATIENGASAVDALETETGMNIRYNLNGIRINDNEPVRGLYINSDGTKHLSR